MVQVMPNVSCLVTGQLSAIQLVEETYSYVLRLIIELTNRIVHRRKEEYALCNVYF